jgi:hypothetical protein
MVTNYEVEEFLRGIRDEDPQVKGIVTNFLKVLDDVNNPDLEPARKRLHELMQRDLKIGKNKRVWEVFAKRLEEGQDETDKTNGPKKKVIEDGGLTPYFP